MAKPMKPAPVVITKFDAGQPVAVETVQPLPEYKKRMLGLPTLRKDEWEPDDIRCDIRIMGRLKKGGTTVLGFAHKGTVEEKMARFNKRVDLELVYQEKLPPIPLTEEEQAAKDLYDRRVAASRGATVDSGYANPEIGRRMVDSDAYHVKFGTLRSLKHGDAAKALGLTYGQVYSARKGFTFTHVTEKA